MKRSHPNSRIEIWSSNYINEENYKQRNEKDRLARILQIEKGSGDCNYIVEVLDKEYQDETTI